MAGIFSEFFTNVAHYIIKRIRHVKEFRIILGLSILFFCILFIVLHKVLISLILSVLLFLLASFSAKIGEHIFGNYAYGIDLIPFTAILFFYADGYSSAILAIIAMVLISAIATSSFNVDTIMRIFAYAVLGIFTIFFEPSFLTWMILAISFHVIFKFFQNIVDTDTEIDYIEIPINTLLNFVLFKYVAVWLFPLL